MAGRKLREIDLTHVKHVFINRDQHKDNRKKILAQYKAMGIKDPIRCPGVERTPYFIGCGEAHHNALSMFDGSPLLVLEDDAILSENYKPVITVPADAEAVYLGTSTTGKPIAIDVGGDIARIKGMYAAHAVLYLSASYVKHAQQIIRYWIYNRKDHWDKGAAQIQVEHNIYMPHKPFFYQGNDRANENNNENVTKSPIVIHKR